MNSITSLPDSINNNNSHHTNTTPKRDRTLSGGGDKTPVLLSPNAASSPTLRSSRPPQLLGQLFGVEALQDPSKSSTHTTPRTSTTTITAATTHNHVKPQQQPLMMGNSATYLHQQQFTRGGAHSNSTRSLHHCQSAAGASASHHSIPFILTTHNSRSTMESRHSAQKITKQVDGYSVATPSRAAAAKPNTTESPYIASQKKGSTHTCCTIPIAALFVIASVMIAAVFAGITVKSSLAFHAEVDLHVETELSTAVEGMMKFITTPLEESVIYCNQMKAMIEASPHRYACDDANPAQFPGNESNAGFLFDAAMYGFQREHLHAVFQMRQSKRYVNGSTGDRAGVGCAVYPDNNTTTLVLSANGSQFHTVVSSTGELDGLSTRAVGPLTAVDVASTPEYVDVLQTSGSMWFALAATVHGVVETRYTYVEQVVDPSEPDARWAVGVDHDMDDLVTYLLEGTPPLSLGDTHSVPTQVTGAHTTLYDMVSGTLLASTHASMPAADADLRLYAAGAAPVAEVNDAYRDAVARCPHDDACRDQALVSTADSTAVHVAYRVNYDASNLHLLLVSSVPRDYFYADADRTFALTLGLSIGSCVLVIAGCVALLVLIQRPLSSLMDNMVLAAELHNDRVVHTGTYLRDIARLSAVFDGMNQQLLIARSFVPEAVLLGKTEDSQEGLDDDEEGSVMGDTASLNTGRPASTEVVTNSTVSSGGMAKLFNIAEKRVAVLSLNLVGFHALVAPDRQASRTQRIHDVSTELLELAVACAHSERGVMDSFHGDHFTLTYNASRAVGTPLAAAVRTANAFIAEVHGSRTLDGCRGVAAGASAGRAVVGTFGIDGYRRLSVVGEVYRNAHALQQAAVQLLRMNQRAVLRREGCMVDAPALKELGSCPFHMQAVGCIQGSEQRAATCGSAKATPPIVYFALEAGGDDATKAAMEADGEWLYELDAIGASDPYVDANRALLALMDGNIELCRELLDAHAASALALREESHNPLDSGIHTTMTQSLSSGSLGHLPHPQIVDDDVSPAWALVRSHYAHHESRVRSSGSDNNTVITEAQAMLATTRQCSLPWLLFKQ